MSTFNELIDFTRSTTGTYLDSVVYGDELVTNGTFATDSDWIKDSGWTISNGQAQCDGTDGAQFRTIDSPLTDGKTYYISYEITAYTSGDIRVLGQGFYGISGNSVSTVTGIFVATKPYVRFYSSAFNGSIDNVSVKELTGGQVSGTPLLRTAAINEPRLEYDASGNPLGLLIEEGRTNVLLHSEDFTNANWGKTNLTATANAATAPDNTQTADKLQLNSTTAGVYMVQDNSTSSSGYKTVTVYAKDNNAGYVILRVGDQPSSADRYLVLVDLSNGHVVDTAISGNPLNVSHTVTPVGNNWYRVSVTANLNESGIRVAITPYCVSSITHTDGTPENAGGAVGNSVYIWGAQLEQGAFPTSYIPTSGSTVTRNKDVVSVPVERFGYNTSQATVIAYAKSFLPSATTYLWEIGSGSADRNFAKAYNQQSLYVIANSVNTVNLNAGTFTANNYGKLASALKANSFAASLDGGSAVIDNTGAVQLDLPAIAIGQNRSYEETLNGHIKQIQYYPKRLSNTELQLLTQPSASPTMNLTFDGQATSTLVEGFHD